MTTRLSRAALAYAERGTYVFPVHAVTDGRCGCGQANCPRPGKHPVGNLAPSGLHDATLDTQTIQQWWALYPDANIGIATGEGSGITVIDLDRREELDGVKAFAALTKQHLDDPVRATPVSMTGGGGYHLWFAHAKGVGTSSGTMPEGIDVRGDGGYVLAPPSSHASGVAYSWRDGARIDQITPPGMPHWMVDMLTAKAAKKPVPDAVLSGSRNNNLTRLAGGARNVGASEDGILAMLLVENARRCNPPLPEDEVRQIAASVSKYEPGKVPGRVIVGGGGKRVGMVERGDGTLVPISRRGGS